MDDLRMMCEGDDTGPMVNYNVTDATGSSALHKAAANGHVDIMKYLVEHGAVFIENQAGAGPLTWAVLNKQVEAVKYLLATFSAQIDVLKKPEAGMSPLSTAYDSDCQEVRSPIFVLRVFPHSVRTRTFAHQIRPIFCFLLPRLR
jgi:ankyrin repeat protein